jgi:tRNA G18 (ribose-2'-O)-methylase SpoU
MKKLKLDELQRPDVETYKQMTKNSIIVLLDNIRSMNNVGSIFRSCDAFAVEKLLLCGITPKPPHREIHKTALGSTESVHWEYHDNILEIVITLKQQGYLIVAAEQTTHSIKLQDFKNPLKKSVAIVFGNEVEGVSNEVLENCDHIIEIPQHGTKHSINVSVAAGIFIFYLSELIT